MTRFKYFLLFSLLMTGCASKAPMPVDGPLRMWSSQAQMRDIKKNKTQNVSIDVFANNVQQTRIEVSAIMGYRVASVVLSPEKWGAAIYPQKKFYYGQNQTESLASLLQIPLEPSDVLNILWGKKMGAGWKCTGKAEEPSQCEKRESDLRVNWVERTAEKQILHIVSPQFEMKWSLKAPQTEVQFKPDLFTLTQPKGFKAIQLN